MKPSPSSSLFLRPSFLFGLAQLLLWLERLFEKLFQLSSIPPLLFFGTDGEMNASSNPTGPDRLQATITGANLVAQALNSLDGKLFTALANALVTLTDGPLHDVIAADNGNGHVDETHGPAAVLGLYGHAKASVDGMFQAIVRLGNVGEQ